MSVATSVLDMNKKVREHCFCFARVAEEKEQNDVNHRLEGMLFCRRERDSIDTRHVQVVTGIVNSVHGRLEAGKEEERIVVVESVTETVGDNMCVYICGSPHLYVDH
jgi:hypothetical protein